MSKCMELLAITASAIRDKYVGFPDDGMGMKALLVDIVRYLRESGMNDGGSWDCDATKDIEVKQPNAFFPFTLVVEAYATSECDDGPAYAEVTVDQSFLDDLIWLRRLCSENNLLSVTISGGPDHWDMEDDLRIRGDCLRGCDDVFWFEAYPKHASHGVETRDIAIDDLVRIATAGAGTETDNECYRWSGRALYYAASSGLVQDLIEQHQNRSNDQEGGA